MKRWFIPIYLLVLGALAVVAALAFMQPVPPIAPAGLLLAAAAPLAFFAWLAVARPARTDPHPVLPSVGSGLGAVLAMMAVYRYGDAHQPFLVGAVVALAGWLAYLTWYSRQRPVEGAPMPGAPLPAIELEDPDGNPVRRDALLGKPGVLVFYRGNWCPLCTAQIGEIAAAWREVARRGANLWFISSQPQPMTRSIAARFSIPARFLRDPENRAAQALGIEARGATPAGLGLIGYPADAALPAVIVVDDRARVRFIEVAENYRVRPDPATYLGYLEPDAQDRPGNDESV